MSKPQCSASVYRYSYLWPLLCPNKASVERDGKLYCKRHDPVAVAEKQVTKETAYDANRKAAMELGCDKRVAQDLLVRKAAALDQIMAVWKIGSHPPWFFVEELLREFAEDSTLREEATHA